MAYTKLFSTLVTSTVWAEEYATRIVWITMLALADKNGEVQATIPGLARMASVSRDECEKALLIFKSPDRDSRTKDEEGRRIEEVEGGWILINHPKYRKMGSKDDQKSKNAERAARYRERLKRNPPAPKPVEHVTDENASVTPPSRIDTESSETITPPPPEAEENHASVTHNNADITQERDIAEADTEAKVQDGEVPPKESVHPKKKKEDFVLPFSTAEFVETWEKWLKYRSQKRKPLTPISVEMQLSQFAQWGEMRSIRALVHTMRKGWQGIREPEPRDLVTDPPSFDEVKSYAASGGESVRIAEAFFDRMQKSGWFDLTGPVIDWKAAFRFYAANQNRQK